jgi:type II secretory pathway pseudopilin PulG
MNQFIVSKSVDDTGPSRTAHASAGRAQGERGYALVALLAVMALLALFAMAATSNVQQQAQREREKEAIFRGEQVSDAIRAYYQFKSRQGARGPNALPTSMDQLLEGVPSGTKKVQILRLSATKDPLSRSGEWRQISPTSQDLARFVSSLTIYAGGPPPVKTDFAVFAFPQLINVLNTGSTGAAPGGDDDSANADGPFLGVASRSQRNSVITYYGIDRHDEWIFTPLFRESTRRF